MYNMNFCYYISKLQEIFNNRERKGLIQNGYCKVLVCRKGVVLADKLE